MTDKDRIDLDGLITAISKTIEFRKITVGEWTYPQLLLESLQRERELVGLLREARTCVPHPMREGIDAALARYVEEEKHGT